MQKRQKKILENLNNAFLQVVHEREGSKVARFIKRINKEIVDDLENMTASRIKEIIRRSPLQLGNTVKMFMVMSAMSIILKERRLSIHRRKSLEGVIALAGIFAVSQIDSKDKAITFARNVHSSISAPKGNKHKRAGAYINRFVNSNDKLYKEIRKKTDNDLREAQRLSKTSMSKRALKEFKERQEAGEPINKIRNSLKRQYNNHKVINRAVETEGNNLLETTKVEQGKDLGYTHKTWFTQGDDRVRDTRFHKAVHNKRVPIDSDFRGGGQRADHPGDMALQPKDRINCRCYLIMS